MNMSHVYGARTELRSKFSVRGPKTPINWKESRRQRGLSRHESWCRVRRAEMRLRKAVRKLAGQNPKALFLGVTLPVLSGVLTKDRFVSVGGIAAVPESGLYYVDIDYRSVVREYVPYECVPRYPNWWNWGVRDSKFERAGFTRAFDAESLPPPRTMTRVPDALSDRFRLSAEFFVDHYGVQQIRGVAGLGRIPGAARDSNWRTLSVEDLRYNDVWQRLILIGRQLLIVDGWEHSSSAFEQCLFDLDSRFPSRKKRHRELLAS